MKRILMLALICLVAFMPVFAGGSSDKAAADGVYPKGQLLIWSTGQPQFRAPFYQEFLDRQGDATADVTPA